MFTGIVTATGRVSSLEMARGSARLTLRSKKGGAIFRRGESVCVSGVCLTAVRNGAVFEADLSSETLRRSTLGRLRAGDCVNLERALRWGDRLSGHFVLGHVDGIARLLESRRDGRSWTYRFEIPRGLSRFVVEKGSLALDGVSLTVARRRARRFDVALIPETWKRTTLSALRPGSEVNVEIDVLARYGAPGWKRIGAGKRRESG